MSPEVRKRDWPHLFVSTLCPLCKAGGYWPITVWLGSCDNYLFNLNKTSGVWSAFANEIFTDNTIVDVAVDANGLL